MDTSATLPPTTKRSSFVTVVAWIFIVFAGFATFISVIQNVMLYYMFPMHQMNQALNGPSAGKDIPFFARYVFTHIQLFFLCFLAASSGTLISAIGLLKRKNWARIVFICIMSAGIVWNILALIFQNLMFRSALNDIPSQAIDPHFSAVMFVTKIIAYIFVLAISALFAWIIVKLVSHDIKAEFTT